MNSLERVKKALSLSEPDRTPVIEMSISSTLIEKVCRASKTVSSFAEEVGLDVIPYQHSFKRHYLDDGRYITAWGVTKKNSPNSFDFPIKNPIKGWEDFNNYSPPDPPRASELRELRKVASRFSEEKFVMVNSRTSFAWGCELVGFESLLKYFVRDKELAHSVLDTVLEVSTETVRRLIKNGANIIFLGDDYAGNKGPFMSPSHFREFIKPRLAKMVDVSHQEGAFCIKHTDGDISPIIDDIIDTGVDALHPIDPTAGMDLGKVKQLYGDRVCLMGNVDCTEVLTAGSIAEVKADVKRCLRQASPGGGHILASSNSIHSGVKPENYIAMIEAAKKYGVQPIKF